MPADTSDLRSFATEMSQVPQKVTRGIRPVVFKGVNNIRRTMQQDFNESRYFKPAARSITYEVKADGDGISGEVGPDTSTGYASFAHIAYFGGANGGGGTVPDPLEALAIEAPQFEDALSKLLDGVL